jgi:DNA-binding NarL/FixJ family response regulator
LPTSNGSDLAPSLPKLLIADDHHLILDALQAMMKTQFHVLAVDNGQAFINAVDEFQPDAAILDVSMPNGDGFLTARRVLENHPSLPILFLSMHGERSYIEQAAQIGAKAFLSKRIPAEELIAAIKTVLSGQTLLNIPALDTVDEGEKSGLTARQREVLRLIAAGCSAKDIANQLNISVRTAEFHRAAIMQRLSLRSTAQMTRYAISNNIA